MPAPLGGAALSATGAPLGRVALTLPSLAGPSTVEIAKGDTGCSMTPKTGVTPRYSGPALAQTRAVCAQEPHLNRSTR